jgi:hypothetical protein
MNNNDINLVSTDANRLEKRLHHLKLAKMIAFFCLFVVAGISVIVFLVNFTLPIKTVQQDQEQTLSNISSLSQKMGKYYLINDRTTALSDIIVKRNDYITLTNLLLAKLPKELSVTTFNVENNKLEFTVSSTTLVPVRDYIEYVLAINNPKIIRNIRNEGIVLTAVEGKYSLSFKADVF